MAESVLYSASIISKALSLFCPPAFKYSSCILEFQDSKQTSNLKRVEAKNNHAYSIISRGDRSVPGIPDNTNASRRY